MKSASRWSGGPAHGYTYQTQWSISKCEIELNMFF